jgi:hypothetical protein
LQRPTKLFHIYMLCVPFLFPCMYSTSTYIETSAFLLVLQFALLGSLGAVQMLQTREQRKREERERERERERDRERERETAS